MPFSWRFWILWAAAIGLISCSGVHPSTPMHDGPASNPPKGWVDYCARNPQTPRCSQP